MKTSLSYRQNEGFPIALPDSMQAVCLDRSRRGGGQHGIFLIESSGKKWVIKYYSHKRGQPQRLLSNLENYLAVDPEFPHRAAFAMKSRAYKSGGRTDLKFFANQMNILLFLLMCRIWYLNMFPVEL